MDEQLQQVDSGWGFESCCGATVQGTAGVPAWDRAQRPASQLAVRGLSQRALQRACDYIERHIGDRFSLEDLARAACVSRAHFARLFRVSMGTSPMAYLLERRIDRSKRLLLTQNLYISEIAAALGFCDQSHFSRAFRRATGMTPKQYARQYK